MADPNSAIGIRRAFVFSAKIDHPPAFGVATRPMRVSSFLSIASMRPSSFSSRAPCC
jgi:hypothetical protein